MTNSRLIIAFYKFVAVYRQRLDPPINQTELSARIGKCPSYISQLERGEINKLSVQTYVDIMHALGVGPGEWLIAYEQMETGEGGIQ